MCVWGMCIAGEVCVAGGACVRGMHGRGVRTMHPPADTTRYGQ